MIDSPPRPVVNERYRRVVKAVWSAGAARVLSSFAALVTLPLAVRYLGAERFGIWATITTAAAWVNLLDLGIANTLTNQISRAYALGDKEAARRYFTTALVISCAAILSAGAVFNFFFGRIEWVKVLNVSARISPVELNHTIVIAAALMLLALPCNLANKLLAGYQELERSALATGAGAAASIFGMVAGVALHVSLPALYCMSVGWVTFSTFGLLMFTVSQKPWLFPHWSSFDMGAAKELLKSGSPFLLIQVAAVVVFSSDNIIVSHYLGAAQVTPYSVTWRVAGLAAIVQSLIFPALWPAYAEAYARGDYSWIRQTFMATMKGILALNAICALSLICFGRAFIRIWAGAAAVPDRHLVVAMSVWIIINGVMNVESCLLAALNRIRGQAALSISAAIVNVALSVTLVRSIGAIGVIGGTIGSYLTVLLIPQTLIVRGVWRRELRAETALGVYRASQSHAGSD